MCEGLMVQGLELHMERRGQSLHCPLDSDLTILAMSSPYEETFPSRSLTPCVTRGGASLYLDTPPLVSMTTSTLINNA